MPPESWVTPQGRVSQRLAARQRHRHSRKRFLVLILVLATKAASSQILGSGGPKSTSFEMLITNKLLIAVISHLQNQQLAILHISSFLMETKRHTSLGRLVSRQLIAESAPA